MDRPIWRLLQPPVAGIPDTAGLDLKQVSQVHLVSLWPWPLTSDGLNDLENLSSNGHVSLKSSTNKWGDRQITLRWIGVEGRTDGRTGGRPENILPLDVYCWRRIEAKKLCACAKGIEKVPTAGESRPRTKSTKQKLLFTARRSNVLASIPLKISPIATFQHIHVHSNRIVFGFWTIWK